jgi:hypothetical protein
MTNINFAAYLIKYNKSPALTVAYVGIAAFAISIFFWAFPSLETVATYLSIGGLVAVMTGLIANKGRGYNEVDQTNAVKFNDQGIEIRSVLYPYSDITDLQLHYHSYYSQSPNGYYTENAGRIELGMNNTISFKKGDTEVNESFFLGNQSQANMFFDLLNTLKANNIPYSYERRFQQW